MSPVWSSRSVGVNTAANFVSQFVAPALGLLLVPVYVRFLGLGGYGLVALLAALLAFSGIFTRGLGWALQREVARADSTGDAVRVRSLVRTFELGYWAVGGVLGILLATLSGPVSDLLDTNGVGHGTVQTCLLVLAVRLASMFPSSVYQATLLGSRHQLVLNLVNSTMLVLGTTASLVVVVTTRSLVGLYVADLLTAGVTLAALRVCVRRTSPVRTPASRLSRDELRAMARMSAGLAWTQAIGMLTRQLDRFVVGGLTSLASLGVYAAGVAGGRLLSLSYNPYLTAVFPETCAIARDTPRELTGHLLQNTRVVVLTCFGVGVPVVLCGHELLTVWLGAGRMADDGYPVLAVYVVGSMLLALADTQYQLHTALGSTRCGVVVNSAAAAWLPVLMVVLVDRLGIVGGALTWTVYAASTWLAFTGYTYRVLMPGHLRGYLAAVSRPVGVLLLLDVAADLLWRLVLPDEPWPVLAAMAPSAVVVLVVAAVVTFGREQLGAVLDGARRRGNVVQPLS